MTTAGAVDDLQMTTAAEISTAAPELQEFRCERIDLDDVDLCRQIARDLEANFLFAHCGLGPDLHNFLLLSASCFP
jgi:hypothetical protein